MVYNTLSQLWMYKFKPKSNNRNNVSISYSTKVANVTKKNVVQFYCWFEFYYISGGIIISELNALFYSGVYT